MRMQTTLSPEAHSRIRVAQSLELVHSCVELHRQRTTSWRHAIRQDTGHRAFLLRQRCLQAHSHASIERSRCARTTLQAATGLLGGVGTRKLLVWRSGRHTSMLRCHAWHALTPPSPALLSVRRSVRIASRRALPLPLQTWRWPSCRIVSRQWSVVSRQ